MISVQKILEAAKAAKFEMAPLRASDQNRMLLSMVDAIRTGKEEILHANVKDIENARGKIPDVMIDRLMLNEDRVEDMAQGILAVEALESPVGDIEEERFLENGLELRKVRVPLGVVAIIYESRPNVTADAAALCIKSGNVCILRGGSDAILTNTVIVDLLRQAILDVGGPVDAVQLVKDTTHESARALMEARGYVDLLIPRGGKNLIRAVVEGAKGVPVIETGSGICHVYVDAEAELDIALSILDNAKTNRPSVCNAAEVCLVHKDRAEEFLPRAAEMLGAKNVELRLDPRAAKIIPGTPAGPEDFDTEFNDYILAVGIVDSVEEAIRHINTHSTGHSEAIVTASLTAAKLFTELVDSAAVYVNASTRFTDGGEFGLGCEMGISTQKLGARGPMGLRELTSYKYVILGKGQVR